MVFKKLAVNTVWISGSQLLARAIGFFYFIFLARALDVSSFGVLAWITGFVYNFYPLADFGLERFILKRLAREPEKVDFYLVRLLPFRIFLAIGSILASLFLAIIIGIHGEKLFLITVFALAVLPYNIAYLLADLELSQEKTKLYAKTTVGLSLLSALIGFIFAQMGLGAFWLLLSYLLGNSIVLFYLLFTSKRPLGWQIDLKFWKEVVAEVWPLAVLMILAVFYLKVSLVLVGRLLGDYWAGIYGSASKFIEAGILIPQGLALAFFPTASRLLVGNRDQLKAIYKKWLLVAFCLSLPIALGMFVAGSWVIPLVYGVKYLPAVPVFSLFGLLVIFLFTNSLAGNIIQNSDKIKSFVPFAAINFLVTFIGGLILIPKIGVIGGVWAMIAGESFGLIINNFFVFKILNEK